MHDLDLSGFTLDGLSWHEDALGRLDRAIRLYRSLL
jgi:hypothetical protein